MYIYINSTISYILVYRKCDLTKRNDCPKAEYVSKKVQILKTHNLVFLFIYKNVLMDTIMVIIIGDLKKELLFGVKYMQGHQRIKAIKRKMFICKRLSAY